MAMVPLKVGAGAIRSAALPIAFSGNISDTTRRFNLLGAMRGFMSGIRPSQVMALAACILLASDTASATKWPPLHKHAYHGRFAKAKFYIERLKTDVCAYSSDGVAAPHVAAHAGHDEILALLLRSDGNALQLRSRKNADLYHDAALACALPIHFAVAGGSLAALVFILTHGGDANSATCSGITALHIATRRNDKDMVGLLLSEGASPFATDSKGMTAAAQAIDLELHDLADFIVSSTIRGLLKKTAAADADGNPEDPLVYAWAAESLLLKQQLPLFRESKLVRTHSDVSSNRGSRAIHNIHDAVIHDDEWGVHDAISKDWASIFAVDASGRTPLRAALDDGKHWAAYTILLSVGHWLFTGWPGFVSQSDWEKTRTMLRSLFQLDDVLRGEE
jgi:hypothetical protein